MDLKEFLSSNTPQSFLSLLGTTWVDRPVVETDLGTLFDFSQRCVAAKICLAEVEIWDIFRDTLNGLSAATSQASESGLRCVICGNFYKDGEHGSCRETGGVAISEWKRRDAKWNSEIGMELFYRGHTYSLPSR